MNDISEELSLIRTHLLDTIDRDLHLPAQRSRVRQRRSFRLAIPTLGVLAAATAAVVLGMTLSAASPQSAYAAARKAIAATSAGTLDSGTMTSTFVLGNRTIVRTTRWNGNDLAVSSDRPFSSVHEDRNRILLVGGSVYVQGADGSWLHYASESDLGRLDHVLGMARTDVAGGSAAQLIASAYDLQKTVQPDGSIVYTGTITAHGAQVTPTDDITTRLLARMEAGRDAQLKLVVGSDGLVRQMIETANDGSLSSNIQYSQLGSTPPIMPPTIANEAPPGTPPTPTETVPTQTFPTTANTP